jgi:hypothetical protein
MEFEKINEISKVNLINYLISNNFESFNIFKSIYLIIVNKYKQFITDNQFISGFIFFYGCILYVNSLVEDITIYLDDIIEYNLLYILVDNLIDDDCKNKKELFRQMKLCILFPNIFRKFKNKKLNAISEIYRSFIKRRPNVKKDLIKLLKYELQGYKTEKQQDLPYEDYYFNCMKKGNQTVKVINKIINRKNIYNIGFIVQLLDDFMDIEEDLKSNITTLANITLKREGNLNGYLNFIFLEVKNIDFSNSFKLFFNQILFYEITKNKKYFTDEYVKYIKPCSIFDYDYGINLMSFFRKLF